MSRTHDEAPRFLRDFENLTTAQRWRFLRCLTEEFIPDLRAGFFRPGLRIKGVKGQDGVFELTWAPDGRATFTYGSELYPGEPHIVWLRVGTHDIFGGK